MSERSGAGSPAWLPWHSTRDGLSAALVSGAAFVALFMLRGSTLQDALIDGGVAGLVIGLVVGLVVGLSIPAVRIGLVDHRSAVRIDRRATVAMLLAIVLVLSLGIWADTGIEIVEMFAGLGLIALSLRSHWLGYAVARVLLAAGGRLPWRLRSFLEDAHRRGVVRQVGAVYQLRHARLQAVLAADEHAAAAPR